MSSPPVSPRSTRLTGRAAVLAVVICAIALSLAYPVREYLAQRQQIDQLVAQQQMMLTQVKSLQAEQAKLADRPASSSWPGRSSICASPAPSATWSKAAGRCSTAPGRTVRTRAVVRQAVAVGRAGQREPAQRRMITARDAVVIAAQLGRPPRGLLGVAHRCPCGLPDVAETAPRLPDGSPFPTLYYLTCPRACAAVSRLEASGLMREMTARLADLRYARATSRRTATTSPGGTRLREPLVSSRCRRALRRPAGCRNG